MQKGPQEKDLGGLSQRLNLNLLRPTYEKVTQEGANLVKTLDLAPEAEQVRVVVRDAGSGSLGSVTISLVPPQLKPKN